MPNCEARHLARGLCRQHYDRWRKPRVRQPKSVNLADVPPGPIIDPVERILRGITRSDDCWIFRVQNQRGYRRVGFGGTHDYAHRVMYRACFGEIKDGLEIDHLCREPSCVNPGHLEAVTHSVNMKRGYAAKRQRENP